ncbi:hypothetical protein [Allorhizocola rhizosphaerae]|uniref:hypothetical protein n=1 Tax=Allorhizocola rhizosphaerae TaxID=1872709 RepID=UPI000E3CC1C8|nr:hypothetical protein [Allorhizocola rhizosphaerae]
MLAVDQRIYRTYRLDLATAWLHLWIIIPDGARLELAAQETGQAITSITRKDHPLPLPLKPMAAAADSE